MYRIVRGTWREHIRSAGLSALDRYCMGVQSSDPTALRTFWNGTLTKDSTEMGLYIAWYSNNATGGWGNASCLLVQINFNIMSSFMDSLGHFSEYRHHFRVSTVIFTRRMDGDVPAGAKLSCKKQRTVNLSIS
ncbi:hypothetical protein M413DRAFT_347699 [Hebeloma cylindrosporum]|uniref:Uncharacterized protein n=1 Tax=Hebeloma cylindrosporum TaxID=76867 RepID=A0A0C2Y392_HEBCY|nr:hypothetical protein M413DRAFT_347699 [Hebeloma cylindrosporum h7]